MTDTQQRRRMPHLLKVVLVLAGVVAAIVIGTKVANQPAGRSAAPAAPVQPSAPVAATPGTISEGVWLVGPDVVPGTYRSSGAGGGDYCMWSRHSSIEGGPMDAITASDGSYSGQMLVTVKAEDKLFRTHGCEPFAKVG